MIYVPCSKFNKCERYRKRRYGALKVQS